MPSNYSGTAYTFNAPVTLAADPTANLQAVTKQYVDNKLRTYSTTIGDGASTSIAVIHNLGTVDVNVSIFELTGNLRKIDSGVEIRSTSINAVTLIFSSAPASNSLRVTIFSSGGTVSTIDPYTFFDPDYAPTLPSAYDDEFDGSNLDVKWTTVNWGSATATNVNSSVPSSLMIKTTNAVNMIACLQSLPAGDFTVCTKVEDAIQSSLPTLNFGLILSNGTTAGAGSQTTVLRGTYGTQGGYAGAYPATNFTSLGTVISNGYNNKIKYLRIRRSGTTYYWGWSQDGKAWAESSSSLGYTPSHFGLFSVSAGTGVYTASFEFFRYFPSATATLGGVRTLNVAQTSGGSASLWQLRRL